MGNNEGEAARYRVLLTRRAQKDLAGVPQAERGRVVESLAALESWPNHGQDVKKLVDEFPATYRIRRGNWRARFQVDDESKTILIRRVLPRQRAY